MTKEHVPPKSAFNDQTYLQHYVDEFNKAERLQWKTKEVNQTGIYVFTLCERCNNKTGRQYGAGYVNFVKTFAHVAMPENAGTTVEVAVNNFFPARVVKQAVSMILSTSNPIPFTGYEAVWNPLLDTNRSAPPKNAFSKLPDRNRLRTVYNELRSFVKSRTAKQLPASVSLYAHVIANQGSAIRTGIFGTYTRSTRRCFWGVTVGLWPIHWTLVLDGKPDVDLLEVTDWARLDFKEKLSQKIRIPCHWAVGKAPLDFRPPQEIKRHRFIGLMRFEGFRPGPGVNVDKMFEGAISFARGRRRAKWTKEGYLMAEFKSGTYFEAYGIQDWLDGVTRDQAREFLRDYFKESHNGVKHKRKKNKA